MELEGALRLHFDVRVRNRQQLVEAVGGGGLELLADAHAVAAPHEEDGQVARGVGRNLHAVVAVQVGGLGHGQRLEQNLENEQRLVDLSIVEVKLFVYVCETYSRILVLKDSGIPFVTRASRL